MFFIVLIMKCLRRCVCNSIVNSLLYYAKDNKKVLFLRGIVSGNNPALYVRVYLAETDL